MIREAFGQLRNIDSPTRRVSQELQFESLAHASG